MKICRICNEDKSIECFSIARYNHDGLDNRCKACTKIYRENRSLNEGPRRSRTQEELNDKIRGQRPKAGEISIYFLRKADGTVFYVGQTNHPVRRSAEHVKRYGDVTLCIIRNVPERESFYWECKAVVDYTDMGHQLINQGSIDPQRGRKQS